jgi:hypothetical protein
VGLLWCVSCRWCGAGGVSGFGAFYIVIVGL